MAKKKKEDYNNPISSQPVATQKTSTEKKSTSEVKSSAKKAESVVEIPSKKATPTKTSAGDKTAKSATARYTDPRNIITPNEKGGASRKEKLQSFGKAMGKNLVAGAANSTIKNQQRYWTHNDPTAEKYVSRHFSGMNTERDVERGLNENYVTENLLDFLFDTSRNADREHNEGSYFSQADNDRYMQGVEDYWRKQQQREAAADTATENMLNTIDPQTKTGEVLLNASAGIARELPAMAEEAIITAASAGALGPEFAGMRIGKIGARLLKAAPATTARTMRYFDQSFQEALDNGATQDEAVKAAARTALPNAVIESAGGLDALAAKLGSGAAKSAGKSVLRSAARVLEVPASEAVEEGLQGIVERSAKKTTYDEDAVVFDVKQILNDMALGAAGGAILGSAMGVIRRGLTANSQGEIASIIQNEAKKEGLPVSDYEARQAAEQIIGSVLREQESVAQTEQTAPTQQQGGQAGLDLIRQGVNNVEASVEQQSPVRIQENPDGTAIIPVSDTETVQRTPLSEQQNPSSVDEVLRSMGLLAPTQENAAEGLARPLTATDEASRQTAVIAEPQEPAAQGEVEPVTPEMSVPQGEGEIRERGFSNNTLQQAAEAGRVENNLAAAMAGNTYATVTNAQVQAAAASTIDEYGADAVAKYLMSRATETTAAGETRISGGNLNSVEYATALELMQRYSKEGRRGRDMALAMGEIADAAANDAGRLIQYNQTLMTTDPLLYVTKQVRRAKAKGVDLSTNRKQVLAVLAQAAQAAQDGEWDGTVNFEGIEAREGRGFRAPKGQDIGLSAKQMQHIARSAEWIHRMASQTNYTEAEWLAALGSSCLSEAIPAKPESWIGAARRINLLLNLKTTAIRNGGGNLLQMVLENVADLPSAMFAAMLKGEANPEGISSVRLGTKGMASGFGQGFMTSYLALQTGTLQQLNNRYSDMTEMGTRLGGSSENPLWQAFRFMDDLTSFAVSVLDTSFSTSRENQVKNQFASVLSDSEYAELTEELNKIAEEAGQRVTFTNDNPIKTIVTKARNLGRELQRSDKASTRLLGDITTTAFQMLMPFAGVTSTILHTSLSYSPVGFVSGIVDLVGESAKQGGAKNLSMEAQRRIATKLGRAVTGSLLSFAAMFLAAAGKATGRKPDDEVESAIWDITGRTPYSIKFGDYWYDLSALGPAMGLASVGASVYDELGGEMSKENLLPLIKGLMFNSTNIHLNDTLDDGLWDGVKKAAGYIGDRDWGGLMQYLVGQGLGQFTPFSSILRQITYGIDPVIHDTSGENEWEWIWNRELSGLPGVSSSLPASRDAMGQVRERYPNADTDLGRWVNALFNPAATVTQDRSDDPLVQEYASLAMATGDDSVLPGKAPYSLRGSGNVKIPLAGAERDQYQAERMGMINDTVWNLMYEPFYQNLDAEEQANLVKKITGLSEYEASAPLSKSHPGFEMSEQSNAAKLKRQVDAFDTQGVDVLGYFDWYYLTKDITALDENGESVSGLKKSRVAEAIKTNMAKNYTPDQMYWMFLITNGINDPYADKNGYYQQYFGATQSRADFFPEL